MAPQPKILVFDSGLGGLTVFSEIARLRPDSQLIYAADDAGFPYGNLSETVLLSRVLAVIERLIAKFAPHAIVIACNTASTLVLPSLRAKFPQIPFVGTVPAIKPAARLSQSRLISVLATPATVARDYTHDLVRTYAAHCSVTLVGSRRLAGFAEAFMQGENPPDDAILSEIAPSFVSDAGRQTDCVVLACTHYPLLIDLFAKLAPWPVNWIDPAPAIARRTDQVLQDWPQGNSAPSGAQEPNIAIFTGTTAKPPELTEALFRRGINKLMTLSMPIETPGTGLTEKPAAP